MKIKIDDIIVNYVDNTGINQESYKNLVLMSKNNRIFLKNSCVPSDIKRKLLKEKRQKKKNIKKRLQKRQDHF